MMEANILMSFTSLAMAPITAPMAPGLSALWPSVHLAAGVINGPVLTAFIACIGLNVLVALRLLRPGTVDADPSVGGPPTARRVGLGHIARATSAIALLTLVECLALGLLLDLHPFGMVHLVWLNVTLVIPVCGVSLLLAGLRGRTVSVPARLVACLSLLSMPLAYVALFVTPYDLRVEHVTFTVPTERAGSEPIVLGILADLQTTAIGPHEVAAVDALLAGEPDIILLPGDVFQGPKDLFEEVLPEFQTLLSRLQAPGGVFLVPGNTDYRAGLPRLFEGSGVRLLEDETVRIDYKDRTLSIFGANERNVASGPWVENEALPDFEHAPGDDDIRIVLSHRPRIVTELATDTRVDLVIGAHTHGGQVSLPFLGPPLVLSPLPYSIAAGGLHELEGRWVYISRGVGMERGQAPPIRLLVPPEVNFVTLE